MALNARQQYTLGLFRSQDLLLKGFYDEALKALVNDYKTTGNVNPDYISYLNDEVEEEIQEATEDVTTAAVEEPKSLLKKIIVGTAIAYTVYKLIDNKAKRVATNSTNAVLSGGIYKDGVSTSTRLQKAGKTIYDDINIILAQGNKSGLSAVELSRLLESYIDPPRRKIWDEERIKSILGPYYALWNKSLEYNALRIARTAIAHAATEAMKNSGEINPFCQKVQWHSVHAYGRTCQLCIDRDLEIYTLEDLPYDHPNGLCYQTYVFDSSIDDMSKQIKDWINGAEDDLLDNWYNNIQ